ncbi:MAG: branched-chain amino acid transaminase [Nitrososphaerales archaeon]
MSKPLGQYIWMDGEMMPWSEAKVHVLTHALHYGTGVFEGIRAYPSGKAGLMIFRLQDHIERMIRSGKVYHLNVKYSVKEISKIIIEVVRKNKIHESAYIRPLVYVGDGGFGLSYKDHPIRLAIAAFPLQAYFDKPGVKVCISSWRRISEESLPPSVKATGNYLNSAVAKMEAQNNGYDEAVMLDRNGFLSEGTGENLFLVKGGNLITPASSNSILEGVTRDTVITIAGDTGIGVKEMPVSRLDLYNCDEAFLTGTAAEITPILGVDNIKIGKGLIGKTTSALKKSFMNLVNGREKKYRKWLTPVY